MKRSHAEIIVYGSQSCDQATTCLASWQSMQASQIASLLHHRSHLSGYTYGRTTSSSSLYMHNSWCITNLSHHSCSNLLLHPLLVYSLLFSFWATVVEYVFFVLLKANTKAEHLHERSIKSDNSYMRWYSDKKYRNMFPFPSMSDWRFASQIQ